MKPILLTFMSFAVSQAMAYANTSASTIAAPAIPSSLTAQVNPDNSITLNWSDNSVDEQFFFIEYKRSTDTVFSNLYSVAENTTNYQTSPLEAGTSYEFVVRSGLWDTTLQEVVKSAPSNVAMAATYPSPTSAWQTSGYDIHYSLSGGRVGVGFSDFSGLSNDFLLAVDGKMLVEDVAVQLSETWPDYVFDENYERPGLYELEAYLRKNRHLPHIPSADEVATQGVELGVINVKLLEKIEELTLYMIELKKEIDELKEQLDKKK
ncbi:fibronectin type III domain-containing protein [Fulvivirga sp. M361]|uniref:fibronectin type III domain-containing protein n=1 Tax=Fulvivirga sp. M361 TaxID=2594266 RepID=UPI00117ADB92|nr:fibronectin type III domain-containing protein [Fulvivirga sp. M361]TRX58738.1 fibronectin type III domain-containing protein [Fulvivirga sp. M361]